MTVTRIEVAAVTHVGCVRSNNEDSLVIGRLVYNASMTEVVTTSLMVAPPVLCMVADGIGGQAAGEVASQYACQSS